MENKHNSEQKKAWVTPELFNESVEETEGKPTFDFAETTVTFPDWGPS
jgi:hypothetical protein